ncbi:hypothetical protein DLM_0904 [Aquitalea magnusonii]|uniref:Uncharacterized protein n=1 Tax=Aquitalea magnusonii TaxID=332411 RepID=A0A3G9GAY3_9NEIS|nr:hypothetical protein DLM_0904 [Aquitalea magnusonii]
MQGGWRLKQTGAVGVIDGTAPYTCWIPAEHISGEPGSLPRLSSITFRL